MPEKEHPSEPSTLDELSERLRLAQERGRRPDTDGGSRGNALGFAMRLATELVAAVAVGGFIGWALDRWLGTTPLFLLVFFFIGVAAGILNVVRTAKVMNAAAADDTGKGDDGGSLPS